MKTSPTIPLIFVILFISLASIPIFSSYPDTGSEKTSLRSSAPLGYRIHIDNNWTLTNSTYSWCTGAGTSGNPYVIQDIEIDADGEYGILIGNSTDYFRIENVTIYDAGSTIRNSSLVLDNVDNGHLLSNDFSNNNYYGVYMDRCNDFLVEYNHFEDNGNAGMFVQGYNLDESLNIVIRHNTIKGNNQYGIYLDYTDLSDVWNNTFSGLGGQNYGLQVDHSDDNTIRENSFSDHNSHGLYLLVDHDSNVTHNSFLNNANGIQGLISQGSDILYNNMTGNTASGIFFSACDNMLVKGNRLIGNRYGFRVAINSDHNELTENVFQSSTEYGIYIPYDSDYNNTFFDFYKNSFISNPIHVLDTTVDTNWNNSEFGNYWDTYSGTDSNGDGIGEDPYMYSINITDYRPLMVANFSLLDDNDGDGLSDYSELNGVQNQFNGQPTNPYNPDSDGDDLNDGDECTGSGNTYDFIATNPNDEDSDGDGYIDIMEINGSANTYDFSPMDPNKMDSDGDIIDDDDELNLGFNPNDIWHYPKPDLVILSNYSLEGEVISFTVKNIGVWRATGVTVVVNISSISLTLYDDTLTGFELAVNETKEIRILKSEYRNDLVEGENYFLSIYVDPISTINETSEVNNSQENILYKHSLSATGLTSFQLALIITSSIIVVGAVVIASYLLVKQKKQQREFKPLQLMVLERHGSTLLYTHKFSKNGKKTAPDSESTEQQEISTESVNEESKTLKKKNKKEEEPKAEIDEILAAGAFSGIQSLLKSILRTEKGINEISHGEYTIYFNYGENIICVMIAYGKFHRILTNLKGFSDTFENDFKNEIAEFDGRVDVFSRAYQIVEKFFSK